MPYCRRLYRSRIILKPILGVAATGVIAVLLWNLVVAFLLPFAVGLVFLVAKVVFFVVMLCVAIWLFRRLSRAEEKPA